MPLDAIKKQLGLDSLILLLALVQTGWLVWYYFTGLGGPQELVARVMPIALALQILFMHRQGPFYKWLPPAADGAVVAIYLAICALAFWHFWLEFEEIAIYRQGSYTRQDFIVGLLLLLLVMELSRLAHPALFWTNVVLVLYTMYGYLAPIDFFWHPGTTFYRVVTSSTVELSTGIYGIYGQLALTLIAAFLLLAGVANGFEAQRAMINVMRALDGRSRQMVPQTAVLGSTAIGMISGSGSANAAVVGTITIPLMMRYGVPPTFAAAVETAASMGGLIMPPMMGVGAFLMAEFLGVPYWDVVLRGFGLAFVYYASIGMAVYLLCVRLLPAESVAAPVVPLYDRVKTTIFMISVLYLLYQMGWAGTGELMAALKTAGLMLALLVAAFLVFKHHRRDPALAGETLVRNLRSAVETLAEMTSYLALLLATLGIMIGLFTVTGFINRMGGMLLQLGAWNIIAMVAMAWVFGWLAGAGLPPTATYIVGAVVIVRPMQELGVDPWIAHFFVFLMSVWGELSPPTSLTAAVSARIADASFLRTMYEALKICAPITLMTFAIFTRPSMV
ncbi:MAG: TRAP transporter permease, partial [Hyphomicrobiales bacterium]|nr:TRAP transporter permease [Hyphomicrobiales bacterium]